MDNYSYLVDGWKEYFRKYNLTEGEIQYIINKIRKAIHKTHDNCVNNFRFCVDGDNEKEYKRVFENGCCGFYDNQIKLKRGMVIKFGFNYGH